MSARSLESSSPPRWPPASVPWTTSASAPAATAAATSAGEPIVTQTAVPAACNRPTSVGGGAAEGRRDDRDTRVREHCRLRVEFVVVEVRPAELDLVAGRLSGQCVSIGGERLAVDGTLLEDEQVHSERGRRELAHPLDLSPQHRCALVAGGQESEATRS